MPISKQTRQKIAFGSPIPGSSLTKEFGNANYEKPPQFTKLTDAINYLVEQLLDPFYSKQLLQLIDAGMAIEAIARTLIFTGFSLGRWTPDLAMLLYKPLMLFLVAFAHRAGLKDAVVLIPGAVASNQMNSLKSHMQATAMKDMRKKALTPFPTAEEIPEAAAAPPITGQGGFMSRGNS